MSCTNVPYLGSRCLPGRVLRSAELRDQLCNSSLRKDEVNAICHSCDHGPPCSTWSSGTLRLRHPEPAISE